MVLPKADLGMDWLIANQARVQYSSQVISEGARIWFVRALSSGELLGQGKSLAEALDKAARKARNVNSK